MRFKSIALRLTAALAMFGVCSGCAFSQKAPKINAKSPQQLRVDYINRLQEHYVPEADERTVGSLWSAQGPLVGFAVDYKAYHLNDTITIQISVQTTATQSGTVDSERTFTTSSAITGIMGRTPAAVNPLLSANSSSALKGQGSTAHNTLFATSLTGQVIAVLPNGNLVVEAERQIFMNNQHENVIVRGMIRPGDIGPNNTVASTALSNLEIEMKGKGIIADSVRPLNPIARAILWLLNF
jgi:flagellar L-ring protein precursor FlgH